jgi:hypothetical protein
VSRVWRVEKTGTVGTISLAIDTQDPQFDLPQASSSNGRLYVTIDDETGVTPTFTDETVVGGTVIRLYDDATNGDETAGDGVFSVSGLTLANGAYFTVTQDTPPSPG